MGAWGHEPWENDTAADFFYSLEKKPVTQVVEAGLNSTDYHEQIAAAWLMTRIGFNFVYSIDLLDDHLRKSIICLKKVLKDKKWLNSWREPKEQKNILESIVQMLESLLPKKRK